MLQHKRVANLRQIVRTWCLPHMRLRMRTLLKILQVVQADLKVNKFSL